MAKQSNKGNYDTVGAIFDFIFKEAEKKPEKRRPIKTTGISGESLLTDALVASLEMPGAFVTKTVIDEFNRMIDVKLGDVVFDSNGKMSISTGKIIDLLRDPGGYVQTSIDDAKATNKASRIRFLGEMMDDFLTTSWAHEYGDLEAKQIMLARASANEKDEKYKVSRAIGQNIRTETLMNVDFMRDRSLELIGRRTFGSAWDTMGNQEKADFTNRLTNSGAFIKKDPKTGKDMAVEDWGGAAFSGDIQRYLAQKYGRQEVQNFSRAMHSRNATDKLDLSNPELYRTLERDYLRSKIGPLKKAVAGSQDEKDRKIYEKSLVMVNLRNEKQMKDLETALEKETDAAKRIEIEGAIKDAQIARKLLGNRNNLLGGLGKLEGYLDSVNRVWGGVLGAQNLVPSILNGNFFDEGKNGAFSPTTLREIGGIKILKAKKTSGKGSAFKNAYYQMGESLYYVTPKSVLRTFLFNGEGFAFLLSKQIESLQNIAGLSQNDLLEQFNKNVSGKEMDLFIQRTLAKMKASGLSAKELARIESILKKSKSLKNLTNIFSLPSRFKGAIEKLINDKLKVARAKFARFLMNNKTLRKWMLKSGASKLLGTWITNGGIKTLVRSLITSAVAAAGVVLTPLGSLVISALTWIATDLLIKMLKVFMSLGALMALGLIGVFVLVLGSGGKSTRSYNKSTYSYRHVIPDTVETCQAYGYGGSVSGPDNPIIPPSTEQECILGSQGISCSQGFVTEDVYCWSHFRYSLREEMPVDLTNVEYIYAPQFCSTGDCRITEIRPIDCYGSDAGGIVVLEASDGSTNYWFNLLHVHPLASLGEKLSGGQPVAYVQFDLTDGPCWTGPHLHLETKQNGQVVDPLALLKAFNCNVPDETSCVDSPFTEFKYSNPVNCPWNL